MVAARSAQGKLALYSDWSPDSTTVLSSGQEGELYDYSTQSGRLELHNSFEQSQLEDTLRSQLEDSRDYIFNKANIPKNLFSAQ